MHIETELDDVYAERLMQLQHRLQQPLAQVIATAIDTTLAQLTAEQDAEPSPLYRAFEATGLIGCIEIDEQLATTYKQKLDFFHKQTLMIQYADLPMDLADASLVLLAEHLGHGHIVSTDQRDFHTYRSKNHHPFHNLLQAC